MRKALRWLLFGVIILSLLLGTTGGSVPAADAAAWQEKVDPWVISNSSDGEVEFLVFLRVQADLSGATAIKDKSAKGSYVYENSHFDR